MHTILTMFLRHSENMKCKHQIHWCSCNHKFLTKKNIKTIFIIIQLHYYVAIAITQRRDFIIATETIPFGGLPISGIVMMNLTWDLMNRRHYGLPIAYLRKLLNQKHEQKGNAKRSYNGLPLISSRFMYNWYLHNIKQHKHEYILHNYIHFPQ